MATPREHDGYRSFDYLEAGADYPPYELAAQLDRVAPTEIVLTAEEAARAERLAAECVMVSLHEHLSLFPMDQHPSPGGGGSDQGIGNCRGRKQRRLSESGSDGDWEFVLGSVHHLEVGGGLSDLLGIRTVSRWVLDES